jgi:hypothetical protein
MSDPAKFQQFKTGVAKAGLAAPPEYTGDNTGYDAWLEKMYPQFAQAYLADPHAAQKAWAGKTGNQFQQLYEKARERGYLGAGNTPGPNYKPYTAAGGGASEGVTAAQAPSKGVGDIPALPKKNILDQMGDALAGLGW